jgi:hypothetical protein
MGLGWRTFAPKPAKTARRAVTRPAKTGRQLVTPTGAKKASSTAWRAANPNTGLRQEVEGRAIADARQRLHIQQASDPPSSPAGGTVSVLWRVLFPAMLLPLALILPLRALGVSDAVGGPLWFVCFMVLLIALGIPWVRRERRLKAERPQTQQIAAMSGAALPQEVRRREPIPERVRHEVWRRDQGRCVRCGSQERLEFDHIIPWSRGGSDTPRNLQLLCERCNRRKSAQI